MPLQGVLLSHKTKTQGDALGLELLPLQGVLDNFNRTGGVLGN